jgi:hypothetical protein
MAAAVLQEASVFLFEKRCAEKLHKPKRKETVTEILRASVRQLGRFRHPKILQVLHSVEECSETLAFASEPVLASLANVLAYQESGGGGGVGPPSTGTASQAQSATSPRPPHAREYHFLDVELKYGILQVSLSFESLVNIPTNYSPCLPLREPHTETSVTRQRDTFPALSVASHFIALFRILSQACPLHVFLHLSFIVHYYKIAIYS